VKLFIPRKNYLSGKPHGDDELANYLAIERWANSLDLGGTGGPQPFSFEGTLVAVSASGRWSPRTPMSIGGAYCTLTTAGSTQTVVTLKRNGVSLGTVTIAASATSGSGTWTAAEFDGEDDYLTAEITTAGTSAKDLVVHPEEA
jgi:hypothetical protein